MKTPFWVHNKADDYEMKMTLNGMVLDDNLMLASAQFIAVFGTILSIISCWLRGDTRHNSAQYSARFGASLA